MAHQLSPGVERRARLQAKQDKPAPRFATHDSPTLHALWTAHGIPAYCTEYRFDVARRWRMDFAWPDHKVFLEVQGGIFIQGRHNRGAAMLKEWEKINAASAQGWRVLYCTPKQLKTDELIGTILLAIGATPSAAGK